MSLLARGILEPLRLALGASPVVVLEGGRATGKSSVGALLVANGDLAQVVDVSEPANLLAARSSPSSFIDRVPTPCLIDEAQLVPELTLAVKRRVDRERQPGLFVLTGSSRLGRTALGGSDPLAGRALRLRLWPMTQSELAGAPRSALLSLLDGQIPQATEPIDHVELLSLMRRGGLPGLALNEMPDAVRAQYLAEYLESVVAHENKRRHDRAELIRLARLLCASTASLLNVSSVADELGATRETVSARLATLESLFLVHRLAGHRPNERKVLSAHPKVHAVDIGFAAWAARTTDPAHTFGGLVETLVVNELVAQASWTSSPIEVRHWRDPARKAEVDAVVMREDGSSVGVEVKAGVDLRPEDLRGLRAYLDATPSATRGIVFYGGGLSLELDERIDAVPIRSLLTP